MHLNDKPGLRTSQPARWWPQDTLTGTPGDDTLLGTAGDDTLNGGLGADQMTGGDGADTYIVDNAGDVVIEHTQPGFFINDRVFATVDYTLTDNVEVLILGGTADLNGTGNSGDNSITGNAGDNRLIGGGGFDTLSGQDGDDWLEGGTELHGDAGNDTLTGDGFLLGDSGNDVLFMTGSDTALGGDGDDMLQAGTVDGYSLDGGAGNDTVVGGNLKGHDPSISGGNGNDLMTARVGSPLNGDAGNDTLQGSSGRDVLDGGTGADLVMGNAGSDTFIDTDTDADTFIGGAGEDRLQMDLSSRDTDLVWHNRPDTEQQFLGNTISSIDGYLLTLGGGNDLLDNRLGNGRDQIFAGRGNDTLYTGGGSDTLNGAGGSDVVSAGGDRDVVSDFDLSIDTLLGGAGVDLLEADWGDTTDDIVWNNDGVTAVDVNGQWIGGFERLWVTLGSGNDSYRSTADGDDDIDAMAGNDTLDGGDGRDNLNGGDGDDTLVGGSGDDWLEATGGDDLLDGGAGIDSLYGGDGNDRFLFAESDAADAVRGFESGIDQLVFMQSLLPVGNADGVVDGARITASPGGHAAADELVIATADIKGSITAAKAAAAIGSATDSYAEGQTALFVVDNGHDSAVYYFESGGANADVSAGELTLLATLEAIKTTAVDDYVFSA